jgi:uncharacterized ion transporter superfamily protein YfcC
MSSVRELLRPAVASRVRQCHDAATQPEAASNDLSSLARDRAPVMVAEVLVVIEIILDVLIQPTSAKAAISMPILWPITQLTGVTGRTTVLAYLIGNG